MFANLLLVDEVNRASPKTQAALLECMEERQVTVDGVTYPLEPPFMVMATQNPIEYEGTYPLPEAQLDRFTMRVSLGYPPLAEEARMLDEQTRTAGRRWSRSSRLPLRPTCSGWSKRRGACTSRRASAATSSRSCGTRAADQRLYLGASPRAGIALLRVAKARALSEGRDYVTPDDVKAVAAPGAGASPDPRAGSSLGRARSGGARRGRPRSHTRFRSDDRARPSGTRCSASSAGSSPCVFGSPALFPVAAGLVIAVPLAVAWVRITLRQPRLSRRWRQEDAVWRNDDLLERDDVRIQIELEREPGVPLPSVVARERIGRLGEQEVELRPHSRGRHWGSYRLYNVPRGRHRFDPVRLSITDPFGLAEARLMLDEQQALVVYPRLVDLERLFFDGGAGPERR